MKKIIKCVKMGINGEGIGYFEKKPVFIDGVFPDETVEVEFDNFDKFTKAKVKKILRVNSERINSKCKYQEKCSCPLMTLNYPAQLKYKKEVLCESLYKYAGIQKDKISDVIGNENIYNYRNQCKLPIGFDGGLYTGLYKPNTNNLIKIDECIIHDKKLESVKKYVLKILVKHKIKSFDVKSKKGIRHLVIRCLNDKCQVTLVGGDNEYSEEFIQEVLNNKDIVSLYKNVNNNKKSVEIFGDKEIVLGGSKYLDFNINGLNVSLSPKSFFQLNKNQAEKMYRIVFDSVKPCDKIFEAYCGVGVMSLMLAKKTKNVIGVESVEDAISNAKINAKNNNIKNVEFVCGDAGKMLSKYRDIDCLVVDPPRSGLDNTMIESILKSNIKQIVYVSCNPSTLGKNLNELKKSYKIKKIIPIDFFSHTVHVETVCLLSKLNTQNILTEN